MTTPDFTPEHTSRRVADNLHPEVKAAYAYVDSVLHAADAHSPFGGYAWHGWAIREAFLAGCSHAALATPPPEPPTIGSVEDAAKAIYSDAMIWAAANASGGAIPSWVERGNSTAQDVARRVARSLIAPPPEPPTDTE